MVCEELIDDFLLGFYSIRTEEDSVSYRFIVHDSFDSYEEAQNCIYQLRERDKQTLELMPLSSNG